MKARNLIPVAVAALALAGSAQAAPIRECGHLNTAFRGYEAAFNITSRNVSCSDARGLAFHFAKTVVGRNYDLGPRRSHTWRTGSWTSHANWIPFGGGFSR
jgi:hypothetical protein